MKNQINQSQPGEAWTRSAEASHDQRRDEEAEKKLTGTLGEMSLLMETCNFVLIEAKHALVNFYRDQCSLALQLGSVLIKIVMSPISQSDRQALGTREEPKSDIRKQI